MTAASEGRRNLETYLRASIVAVRAAGSLEALDCGQIYKQIIEYRNAVEEPDMDLIHQARSIAKGKSLEEEAAKAQYQQKILAKGGTK